MDDAKDLNLLEKWRQVSVAKKMLDNVALDFTFIRFIITDDVETVQQSSE